MEIEMINKDYRSTRRQLENIDTVTTNRKELQQLAQLHILGITRSMRQGSYNKQVAINSLSSIQFVGTAHKLSRLTNWLSS
jgi:hypothetical protein